MYLFSACTQCNCASLCSDRAERTCSLGDVLSRVTRVHPYGWSGTEQAPESPIGVRASGLTVSRKNRPWQPEADSRLSPGPAGHIAKRVVKRNAGHPLAGAPSSAGTCGNHAFALEAHQDEHPFCKREAVGSRPAGSSSRKTEMLAAPDGQLTALSVGSHPTRADNLSRCIRRAVPLVSAARDRATFWRLSWTTT